MNHACGIAISVNCSPELHAPMNLPNEILLFAIGVFIGAEVAQRT